MTTAEDWYGGLAILRRMRAPRDFAGVHLIRWRQIIEDAESFLAQWEHEARELGWTALDLFGCDPLMPYARIDYSGLVLLLRGCPVSSLSDRRAGVPISPQRVNYFTRRPAQPGQIALWEVGRSSQARLPSDAA